VNIRINNDKLKAYRLTGSFENETIEEALKAMQYLVSFKYRIENRNVVITQ
jgi:ferric-dicitrate binding protein FerR (iron transport regulator)